MATCAFSVPRLPRALRKIAPIPCALGRPTEAALLVPGGDSGSFYGQVFLRPITAWRGPPTGEGGSPRTGVPPGAHLGGKPSGRTSVGPRTHLQGVMGRSRSEFFLQVGQVLCVSTHLRFIFLFTRKQDNPNVCMWSFRREGGKREGV